MPRLTEVLLAVLLLPLLSQAHGLHWSNGRASSSPGDVGLRARLTALAQGFHLPGLRPPAPRPPTGRLALAPVLTKYIPPSSTGKVTLGILGPRRQEIHIIYPPSRSVKEEMVTRGAGPRPVRESPAGGREQLEDGWAGYMVEDLAAPAPRPPAPGTRPRDEVVLGSRLHHDEVEVGVGTEPCRAASCRVEKEAALGIRPEAEAPQMVAGHRLLPGEMVGKVMGKKVVGNNVGEGVVGHMAPLDWGHSIQQALRGATAREPARREVFHERQQVPPSSEEDLVSLVFMEEKEDRAVWPGVVEEFQDMMELPVLELDTTINEVDGPVDRWPVDGLVVDGPVVELVDGPQIHDNAAGAVEGWELPSPGVRTVGPGMRQAELFRSQFFQSPSFSQDPFRIPDSFRSVLGDPDTWGPQ